jgi:hypothetical protein
MPQGIPSPGSASEGPEGREASSREFYERLLDLAIAEIDGLGGDVVMVCGPIRGAEGDNAQENLARLQARIAEISEQGETVFDQTPYEEGNLSSLGIEGAPHDIPTKMRVFFQGIIASKRISKIYVLPGWERSSGTTKEVGYATTHGVPIEYLSV